jgi:hypothetical protein
LPPTNLPVRLDQRFAIDPCAPSFDDLAISKVTLLEPRTPHQPGKLQKLSKNEFVLLLLFLESMEMTRLYVLCQQASARRPQRGELNVVQSRSGVLLDGAEVLDLTMRLMFCGGRDSRPADAELCISRGKPHYARVQCDGIIEGSGARDSPRSCCLPLKPTTLAKSS